MACPAEEAAQSWWADVLLWGRGHRDKVARICLWARELKKDVPEAYCRPE